MSSGRQIFQILGTAVGTFFGGPWGGAIGGIIGGEIGGAIDGPQQGPRLDDRTAPDIEYGSQVPRVYGRVWVTLSPLWWSRLRESSTTVSGKGSDRDVEEYSYRCDLLGRLADGSNVLDWTRIEIDGKIVATRLADSSAGSLAQSADTDSWGDVELFSGAADQAPWSVYEAAVGVDDACAYRDQCTIGFTDLLMPNGRRPSNIRVEVITTATTQPGNVFLLLNFESVTFTDESSWEHAILTENVEIVAGAQRFGTYGARNTVTTNNNVQIYANTSVPWAGSGGMTWEAWINLANGDPGAGWSFTVNTNAGPLRVGVDDDVAPDLKRLSVYAFDEGSVSTSVAPPEYPTSTGSHMHVAGDYDPATGTVTMYVNGSPLLSHTHSGSPPAVTTITSGGFYVSADAFALGDFRVDGMRFTRNVRRYPAAFTPPSVAPTDDAGAIYEPLPEDLQDVLEAEILRCAPLTSGDIDMSAAAGMEVHGYKAYGSAAQAISPLLSWFFLDLFCLDRITAVARGGANEQTIPYSWTGAGSERSEEGFAGLQRGNDVEVPLACAVQYVNILADGESGTEEGERIGIGADIKAVTCPIYALPTEAKGRANAFTWDLRVSADVATVTLSARHGVTIQPGSILTLVDNKGISYRVCVTRVLWRKGNIYECEVRADDPNVLTDIGVTSEAYVPVIEVDIPVDADFLALDTPLLDDELDTPHYMAFVKTEGSSVAARWYQSEDNTSFDVIGPTFRNDAVFGEITAISGTLQAPGMIDNYLRITVDVGEGTLASTTRSGILTSRTRNAFVAGVNGRLVCGQVVTCTLSAPGVYVLTGLLLGLKGTEQYVGDLEVGDSFVMLGTAGTSPIDLRSWQLNMELFIKAVSSGRATDRVAGVSFTPTGEALKPRSPMQLRVTRDASNGDIDATFNRRTRMSTRFGSDLGDSVPLGEESEQYRVRFYTDGTYATVVRDVGIVTSPEFSYTGAQRTTDYGSSSATAYVGIAQISAIVGEGHQLRATV